MFALARLYRWVWHWSGTLRLYEMCVSETYWPGSEGESGRCYYLWYGTVQSTPCLARNCCRAGLNRPFIQDCSASTSRINLIMVRTFCVIRSANEHLAACSPLPASDTNTPSTASNCHLTPSENVYTGFLLLLCAAEVYYGGSFSLELVDCCFVFSRVERRNRCGRCLVKHLIKQTPRCRHHLLRVESTWCGTGHAVGGVHAIEPLKRWFGDQTGNTCNMKDRCSHAATNLQDREVCCSDRTRARAVQISGQQVLRM